VTLDPLPVVLVTVLGCLGWWPTDDRLFGSWFTLNVCLTLRSEPVAAVCDTHTRQETFTHESGYCCSYGSSENTARPPEFHRVWNGISCVWKRDALGYSRLTDTDREYKRRRKVLARTIIFEITKYLPSPASSGGFKI